MENPTYAPNFVSNILSCLTLPDFLTKMIPSLLLDYFDVQDWKILLGIISFEILVASS